MNYKDLRDEAETGDILLCAGESPASRMVRTLTGSQYSHVALLARWPDFGLFVSEVKPGTGYTLTPASQRIPELLKGGVVRYGKKPQHLNQKMIGQAILKFRDGSANRDLDPSYSYLSGIIIWLSQLINKPLPHAFVCSTYAQHIWEEGGMKFKRSADPEDFARHVENLRKITL